MSKKNEVLKRNEVALKQPKLVRIRDYNTVLATIIKDERLSGNRRLLAALLGKHFSIGNKNGKAVPMTEQEAKDKGLLYSILLTQFGNPKVIQWLDAEDTETLPPPTKIEAEASENIRTVFEALLAPSKKAGE